MSARWSHILLVLCRCHTGLQTGQGPHGNHQLLGKTVWPFGECFLRGCLLLLNVLHCFSCSQIAAVVSSLQTVCKHVTTTYQPAVKMWRVRQEAETVCLQSKSSKAWLLLWRQMVSVSGVLWLSQVSLLLGGWRVLADRLVSACLSVPLIGSTCTTILWFEFVSCRRKKRRRLQWIWTLLLYLSHERSRAQWTETAALCC